MSEPKRGVVWDLSSYFTAFDGPDMRAFKASLQADVQALQETAGDLPELDAASADQWEALILQAEDLMNRLGHLSSYLSCLEAAYADREEYARERAVLTQLMAEVEKFDVEVLRAFKGAAPETFEAFVTRAPLQDAGHYLRRVRERSRFTMSREQEILAADLNVDGFKAWGRLYDRITGKLEFDFVNAEGHSERRPISQWRALMANTDRKIGRAAFEGGNRAWQGIEDVCAAALNAIAGARLALYRHRGVPHFLDRALFQAAISQETLAAMYRAIHARLELAREILRAKARFFGRTGIWFFEREAPLPLKDSRTYTWPEATAMVRAAFQRAYPALADYYQGMLVRRWIESEARPAKRPGAFCTGSGWTREQRVFMTFNGALGNLTTMAHEVGHAWHGHLMRDMRPMARRYPMTLAETASVFAEHIFAHGILQDNRLSDSQKFMMRDAELSDAAVMLLDITTRFEFEKALYDERQQGEVSVSRLKALMANTQRRIYGDALLEDGFDPYFWASKLHFYITGTTFYNFPYTFGFLLTRALIARFQREGPDFLPHYEAFLKLSGSAAVEEVVQRSLGMDVTQEDFWSQAIASLEPALARYKGLIDRYA